MFSSQYKLLPSFTLYIALFFGILMLGCVRINSPNPTSMVNPFTLPPFIVITNCAEAPYMVKPAARRSVPGINKSPFVTFRPGPTHLSGSLKTPKIVPTLTPASRFELPSIGSQATAYLALGCSSKIIASSSSSLTTMRQRPEPRMAAIKISLPITSSFFWSSPVVLEEPARPERFARLARRIQ